MPLSRVDDCVDFNLKNRISLKVNWVMPCIICNHLRLEMLDWIE